MIEKIILGHDKKKLGRKPIIFTEEMMAHIKRLTMTGTSKKEIAETLGMGVATLFRKIASDKEFQEEVWRVQRLRRSPYKKRDMEYWNNLIRLGAENHRIRKSLQWKKFELMIKKGISYRRAHNLIKQMLEPSDPIAGSQ